MAMVTLAELIAGVATTLSAAASVKSVKEADEIPESKHSLPMICVWPAEEGEVSGTIGTHAMGLTAGYNIEPIVINADLFARQRSHLGKQMADMVTAIDEVRAILVGLQRPYFGLDQIGSFTWGWQAVTWTEGEGRTAVQYAGARFVLRIEAGPED